MPLRRPRLKSIIGVCLLVGLCGTAPAAPAALADGPRAPVPAGPRAVLAAGPRASAGPRATATRLGSAPASQRISLVLPLEADLAGLERFATAVTTPGSAQYGQFEPIAALARQFGASAGTRARVVSYLRRAGASAVKIDATGLFADATMPIASAQRLFGTSLARFAAADAQRYIAPTGAARVPPSLRGAVTGVVGLDTQPLPGAPPPAVTGAFPHARRQTVASDNSPSLYGTRSGTPAGCAGALAQHGFTPNQYLDAYGYSPLQQEKIAGQGERVALIEIDGFRYRDLRTFASCFGLGVPAIEGYGVGLKRQLAPGGETTLDLELLDAAAPGLKAVDVYESRNRAADFLRSLTAPLQNRGRMPEVISASVGICEPALLQSVGFAGIRAAEGALAAAAASGVSVLASSGDDGSTACIGRRGPIDALAVNFPASSPFVTAVGGTQIVLNAANQITRQTVWNDGPFDLAAGGGGLSGLFRRPSYQKGSVAVNRRAIPDVSLLADLQPGYEIYCTAHGDCLNRGNPSNPWVAVGGTSAAAPLLAGGLALVDQVLRKQQRQQLGNANALLYRIARSGAGASVFGDVTTNDNDLGPYIGKHRSLHCCSARPGYDFASGLGSVNLYRLALLAAGLTPRLASVGVSLPRQRPLARRHLVVRVSCSRRCLVASLGVVTIGRAKPFFVRSGSYLLARRGSRQIALGFSRRELRRMRAALRERQRLYATVLGVIIDSSGNIERVSRPRRLRITS